MAISEAERLLNVEKVDILAGVYSSAHAVLLAEKVDRQTRFQWITTAISGIYGGVRDRSGRSEQWRSGPDTCSMGPTIERQEA